MPNMNKRIRETDANHFDTCILETGFLQCRVLTTGRLAGWIRCEQPYKGYGNWFLIFVYPLYKMTQLDSKRFCKDVPPDNTNFICLFVHGRAAVDVIYKFTTYNKKWKFAIAFAGDDKEEFHFLTSTKESLTFEVILTDDIIFLSGNLTRLSNDFDYSKKKELAHIIRYISTRGLFCSEICKIAEKNIELIIIYEMEDGFNASVTEMEHEFAKLRNLKRLHLTHEATATRTGESSVPIIKLTESENTNTLQDISQNSSDSSIEVLNADNNTSNYSESNRLETLESKTETESRISTNLEELKNTRKNIEPLCKTTTERCKIFDKRRRVTGDYDFSFSRNNQPPFLPTTFKILDSLRSINMSVMIDCSFPQTELRSRGAYDLEFDKFLANKNKEKGFEQLKRVIPENREIELK